MSCGYMGHIQGVGTAYGDLRVHDCIVLSCVLNVCARATGERVRGVQSYDVLGANMRFGARHVLRICEFQFVLRTVCSAANYRQHAMYDV